MKSANARKIFAIALVLVALISIFVPAASAGGSQTWYFWDDMRLDKTDPGSGEVPVLAFAPWDWRAEPVSCDLTMGAGTWKLDLHYAATSDGILQVTVFKGNSGLILAEENPHVIDKEALRCFVWVDYAFLTG